MTKRIIEINIDTNTGNTLYWFIRAIMDKHPEVFNELKEREQ